MFLCSTQTGSRRLLPVVSPEDVIALCSRPVPEGEGTAGLRLAGLVESLVALGLSVRAGMNILIYLCFDLDDALQIGLDFHVC